MAAVSLALALWPHNIDFPRMPLVPLELLPLHQTPSECLQGSESVCEIFKRVSEFLAAFLLNEMERQSPLGFSLPDIVETPLPSIGEPSVGLEALHLLQGPLQPRCSFWYSTPICGFGGQHISQILPSCQSQCGIFFISFVIRILCS